MIINKETGVVSLGNGIKLTPQLALSSFQALSGFSQWSALESGQSISIYEQTTSDNQNRKLTVKVGFRGSRLSVISLSYFLPDETTARIRRVVPGEWGSDRERTQLHRAILHKELGDPPHNYSWGYVGHGANEIDLVAQIHISYRHGAKTNSN